MYNFNQNQIIKIMENDIAYYGKIIACYDIYARIQFFEDHIQEDIPYTELIALPPIYLNRNMYQKLIRMEITLSTLSNTQNINIQNVDHYEITIEDLLIAFEHAKSVNMDEDTLYDEWFVYFKMVFMDMIDQKKKSSILPKYSIYYILDEIIYLLNEDITSSSIEIYDQIIEKCEKLIKHQKNLCLHCNNPYGNIKLYYKLPLELNDMKNMH